jgi:hypothetical protein
MSPKDKCFRAKHVGIQKNNVEIDVCNLVVLLFINTERERLQDEPISVVCVIPHT